MMGLLLKACPHWQQKSPKSATNCRRSYSRRKRQHSCPKRTHFSLFSRFATLWTKTELLQRWPRDVPYISVPYRFLRLPKYAHSYFSQNFNGLLFRSIPWIRVQNLTFVVLPIAEIIGVPKKLGSPFIRPRCIFFKIFNGLLFEWTLWMYRPNLTSVAYPFLR